MNSEKILTLDCISKTYANGNNVLSRISFSLPKGQILGIVGENGAGKTTMIRCILDSLIPEEGKIYFWGKEKDIHDYRVREHIGAVYDDNCFFSQYTPEKLSIVMRQIYLSWDTNLFLSCLARLSVPIKSKINTLSKGQKIKLALAVALSHDTQLLIMDEVTSCLDPISKYEVHKLLEEFVHSGKRSVFFSTHDTAEIEKFADRIIFLVSGEIAMDIEKNDLVKKYGIARITEEQFLAGEWPGAIAYLKRECQVDLLVLRKEHLKSNNLQIDKPTVGETLYILARGIRL